MSVAAPPGLSSAEAQRLLAEAGPNVLAGPPRPSHLRRFAANLVHLFALLLWGGALLALLGGMPQLSVAIVVVVLVNAAFAFAQEYRAERAADALRRMLPQSARVRRDGAVAEIPAEELVPGDVLLLAAGDRVGADAEVVVRQELRVDNSTLTGESRPVEPERLVFAGTHVTRGTAEAVVTATGMATEFGRIAELAQGAHEAPSPLELELRRVTRFVAALSIGFGATFFLVAGWLGMGLSARFTFAIGVMVANVPEGLLPTVTLSLALGTQRMARRNALVRRLSSVETLGATTVICTDKTGTLTENQMTVERVWTPDGTWYDVEGAGYEPFGRFLHDGHAADPRRFRELLRAGLLCNDARLTAGPSGVEIAGDPTEAALVVLAEKGGLRHEREAALRPRVARGAVRLRAAADGDGAPVPRRAGRVREGSRRGDRRPLDAAGGRAARGARGGGGDGAERAARARRGAADAAGAGGDGCGARRDASYELLGVVGMLDPPRPEVTEAVASCHGSRHPHHHGHRRQRADGRGGRPPHRPRRRRRPASAAGVVTGTRAAGDRPATLDGLDDEAEAAPRRPRRDLRPHRPRAEAAARARPAASRGTSSR